MAGSLATADWHDQFSDLADDFGVEGASAALWHADLGLATMTHGHVVPYVPTAPAIDPNHRFTITCLSKVFICSVAIQSLIEHGIPLNDPIRGHFPELLRRSNRADDAITFLHLLSCSAGFDESNLPRHLGCMSNLVELPARLASIQQLCRPGACYIYSPLSVVLLAYVLEKIEADSWRSVIYHRLFKPAGVPLAAGFCSGAHPALAGRKVNVPTIRDAVPLHIDYDRTSLFQQLVASTEMQLTPAETCLIGRDILDLLSGPQVQRIVAEGIGFRSSAYNHQYIDGASFGLLHYHNGCIGFWSDGIGQHNALMIDPRDHRVLAISTNTFPETFFFIALISAVFGSDITSHRDLSPFDPDACIGVYRAEGLRVSLTKVQDALHADVCLRDDDTPLRLAGTLKYSGRGEYNLLQSNTQVTTERLSLFSNDGSRQRPQFIRFANKVCRRTSL